MDRRRKIFIGKTAAILSVVPVLIWAHAAGPRITAIGAGNTFQFDWTPPATDVGNIILYAAGNAANGNDVETGDHIYTTTLTLTPAGAGGNKPTITSVVNGGSFQPGIAGNTYVSILGSG